MRITTQGDYALRCLLSIAAHGEKGPVPISRIAQDEGLPIDYIEQLLMKLRRRKLIRSVRGVNGGYLLERPAGDITVKEVLEAVEGEAFEVICARQKKSRKDDGRGDGCCLRELWLGLKSTIDRHLNGVTIRTLLKRSGVRP